ncbi:hypothetical protein [Sphingobium chungbukense]|uniref:Uncharacterized protein n=1 Tax=Sphingobium chungbukense TaxID=56193 RepID=A0A0M3AK94_9SPHN|nr:hypothetical protein [Sphingobium chungbukense]KKW90260.1 hypothetical protein YP76_19805 [Sphingobium chungbukense]
MLNATERNGLSLKRLELCSRENAVRVANRIFDDHTRKVSILRTGNPLQPFRVSLGPADPRRVVLEIVA